jgi:hypothetical protein
MGLVFPEKKKLVLKAKEIKTLNKAEENAKEITVDDMLAAAEGRTDDTKGKSDPTIAMARAAKIGMIGALLTCLAATAAEILPSTDVLTAPDLGKLLAHPFVFLGVIDVFFAVLLGLGTSAIYPLLRFRAALGLGWMGFVFYAQGQPLPLLQVAIGSVGLYLCTVVVSMLPAIIAAAGGVAGMGTLAWYFLSH